MRVIPLLLLFACASVPQTGEEVVFAAQESALGACRVGVPAGATMPDDPLTRALSATSRCPEEVRAFRALFSDLRPSVVNNRGFHSTAGSLSIFERVGDQQLYFGHFVEGGELQQTPRRGALMIELIVWDEQKGAFNFYEMIGDGHKGQWHYRGDSFVIAQDLKGLHLGEPLGTRMRCSGCHMGGGPIMKEQAPFNDWWTQSRPFDASPVANVHDAGELRAAVDAGNAMLAKSAAWQARPVSLRVKLRPLFCPEGVEFSAADDGKMRAAWLVDERIAKRTFPAVSYDLDALDMRFPETNMRDADHAWLAPVKATSDILSIDALGLDPAFVRAVLSVDFSSPVFSDERCALLQQVPEVEELGWQAQFVQRHIDPDAFLDACAGKLAGLLPTLVARRRQIADSAISKHPRGQILEPGFRVIFPVAHAATAVSPELGADCAAR